MLPTITKETIENYKNKELKDKEIFKKEQPILYERLETVFTYLTPCVLFYGLLRAQLKEEEKI